MIKVLEYKYVAGFFVFSILAMLLITASAFGQVQYQVAQPKSLVLAPAQEPVATNETVQQNTFAFPTMLPTHTMPLTGGALFAYVLNAAFNPLFVVCLILLLLLLYWYQKK